MNFSTNFPALLYFIASIISFGIGLSAINQRNRYGARTFVLIMVAAGLWSLFAALERSLVDFDSKLVFARLQYLCLVNLPLLWLIFILRYTQTYTSITFPRFLLLWIVPLLAAILVLNKPWQGLIWQSVKLPIDSPGGGLSFTYGPWYYLSSVYSNLLNLLGAIVLFWAMIRYPQIFNRQIGALFACIALPWISDILTVSGFDFFAGLSITPLAYIISGLIISWAVFRLNFFDLVPVAREAILDSLSGAVIVVDNKNRIADINRPAIQLFDLNTPESIIGQDISDVFKKHNTLLKLLMSNSQELEEIYLKTDTYIEARLTPLTDTLGRFSLKLVELSDISKRKKDEERILLQSYALEAAANSVMITDRSGTIIWVNSSFSETSGYTKEELVGNNPSILNSGVHTKTYFKNMWDSLLAGRSWRGETVNRKKDGTLYTEEQTIAPILNDHREVIYFISVKQDVSDRKALEKLRDDLVYTIVHDLRNPLTSISMSLDVVERGLKRHDDLPLDQLEMLDIARSNTRRMAGLVNSILDINRLESERMPVNLVALPLRKLVNDAMKFQVALAKSKGVSLENEIPEELPLVAVDIGLIGRVLQNLIDNAIKFTPEGGEIRITAHPDEKQGLYRVCVIDNGPGIPSDVQTRLFQKFASGSEPGHGTGLGLAYCRLAVEAHGGHIFAASGPVGGTAIEFTLPGAELFEEFH